MTFSSNHLFAHTVHFSCPYFFNWSMVDLQCCVSFWCTEVGQLCITHMYIFFFKFFFFWLHHMACWISIPPQATEQHWEPRILTPSPSENDPLPLMVPGGWLQWMLSKEAQLTHSRWMIVHWTCMYKIYFVMSLCQYICKYCSCILSLLCLLFKISLFILPEKGKGFDLFGYKVYREK